MKKNKIFPVLATGANNVSKHVAMAASLPLGYPWLIISCCKVMPTVMYAMEEEKEPETALDKCSMNFAGMFMGIFTTITCCCCCFGCCGTTSPKVLYG